MLTLTPLIHVFFGLSQDVNKSSLVVLMHHLNDALHRIRKCVECGGTVMIEFLNLEVKSWILSGNITRYSQVGIEGGAGQLRQRRRGFLRRGI